MNYKEAIEAFEDAKRTLNRSTELIGNILPMLVDRIELCHSWQSKEALSDLKRKLKNFNSTTKQWKK